MARKGAGKRPQKDAAGRWRLHGRFISAAEARRQRGRIRGGKTRGKQQRVEATARHVHAELRREAKWESYRVEGSFDGDDMAAIARQIIRRHRYRRAAQALAEVEMQDPKTGSRWSGNVISLATVNKAKDLPTQLEGLEWARIEEMHDYPEIIGTTWVEFKFWKAAKLDRPGHAGKTGTQHNLEKRPRKRRRRSKR